MTEIAEMFFLKYCLKIKRVFVRGQALSNIAPAVSKRENIISTFLAYKTPVLFNKTVLRGDHRLQDQSKSSNQRTECSAWSTFRTIYSCTGCYLARPGPGCGQTAVKRNMDGG